MKKIDKFRTIFFQIGLSIALLIVLFAFEWKNYDKININFNDQIAVVIDDDIVLNTIQNKPPPPPPQNQTTILNIVEDDVDVDNDIDIDVEADINTEIEKYIPYIIDDDPIIENEIFIVVEKQPSFIGGQSARIKYLEDNLKYPNMARELGIQGKVYLTFVVEVDGSITDVRLLRGIGGGCDEEALRVIKNMPKWSPGEQRGRKVRVQFNFDINFILMN